LPGDTLDGRENLPLFTGVFTDLRSQVVIARFLNQATGVRMKALQGSFFAASTESENRKTGKTLSLGGSTHNPYPIKNKYLISKPWKNTTHKEGIHGLYTLPEVQQFAPPEKLPKTQIGKAKVFVSAPFFWGEVLNFRGVDIFL